MKKSAVRQLRVNRAMEAMIAIAVIFAVLGCSSIQRLVRPVAEFVLCDIAKNVVSEGLITGIEILASSARFRPCTKENSLEVFVPALTERQRAIAGIISTLNRGDRFDMDFSNPEGEIAEESETTEESGSESGLRHRRVVLKSFNGSRVN
jgi:hypothetical protein